MYGSKEDLENVSARLSVFSHETIKKIVDVCLAPTMAKMSQEGLPLSSMDAVLGGIIFTMTSRFFESLQSDITAEFEKYEKAETDSKEKEELFVSLKQRCTFFNVVHATHQDMVDDKVDGAFDKVQIISKTLKE